MGNSQNYPGLTQDVLEEYTTLTYLGKGEILNLMKKFYSIDPEKLQADSSHRFPKEEIINKFGALKTNPFSDRIFRVFSSEKDDCFSFEDLLDLCSVMSADCPAEVKSAWAFRIFDLDEDNQISKQDITNILDLLVPLAPDNGVYGLDDKSKEKIADVIIREMNMDKSGSISSSEFQYVVSRLPEFETSFYLRL